MTTKQQRWHLALWCAVAVLGVLLLWELVAHVVASGGTIPTPRQVVDEFRDQGWSFYWLLVRNTAFQAAAGWLLGACLAFGLSVLCFSVPVLARALAQLGVVSYALPWIAIAPILVITLNGAMPMITLSALSVFFTTLVLSMVGLTRVNPTWTAVVESAGGKRSDVLMRVRLRSALPNFMLGLQIGAPAAVVGAVVGEYMSDAVGLGSALTVAQSQLNVPRTWCLALLAAALAGVGYGLVAWAIRAWLPWVGDSGRGWLGIERAASSSAAGVARRRSVSLKFGAPVLAAAIVIGGWELYMVLSSAAPFVLRSPLDVAEYLLGTTTPNAASDGVYPALGITLRDAAVGFVVGTVLGVFVAIVTQSFARLDRPVMALALVVRTIPAVVLVPVLTVILGRGQLLVGSVGCLLTFFPTLVNVRDGLRSPSSESLDFLAASGASKADLLRKVRMPAAVPMFLASLRIAVPSAIIGALLAEWLATGKGLGYQIATAVPSFAVAQLWGGAILVTLVSLALYGVVQISDGVISRRMQ